jgi:hypothetical protein
MQSYFRKQAYGTFILFVLLTLIVSCNNGGESSTSQSDTAANVPDTASISKNKKGDTLRVRVVIRSMEGYGVHENFARGATSQLEALLNSGRFETAVVQNEYVHNQGLSPQVIYDRIMLAHEEDGEGGEDHVLDLRLRTLSAETDGKKWMRRCDTNSRSGTIGLDGSGSGIAAICPQWLEKWDHEKDTAALAAHFIHEYMHILGFAHPSQKSSSVPYKIDGIVEALLNAK